MNDSTQTNSRSSSSRITVFAAGLLLAGAFLAVRRNLWVLVIAHALIDTLSWVTTYLG